MLAKKYRITKQKEFDSFFGSNFKQKKGQNASGQFLIIKTYENELGFPRFGFIVNNKVDKRATTRNQIKRKLRELVQAYLKEIKKNNETVVIVKPTITGKGMQIIEQEFLNLLKKTKLL